MTTCRPCLRAALVTTLGLTAFAFATPARAGTIGTGVTTIDYSGSIVPYTVITAGLYDIVAYGADGGGGYFGGSGGLGAVIGGEFSLRANQTLNVLVGGGGGGSGGGGGGGGGGSFVVSGQGATASPLVIAGGGGGGGGGVEPVEDGSGKGRNATTATGGTSGAGIDSYGSGGHGGGFYAGFAVLYYYGGGEGASFGSGGSGGLGPGEPGPYPGSGGNGGYGGGGGGGFMPGDGGYSYSGNYYYYYYPGGGGGGGGGYTGGGGGGYNFIDDANYSYNYYYGDNGGGGGGSFVGPSATSLTLPTSLNALSLNGNGEIVFTYLGPAPASVPEPGTIGLLCTGLLGLRLVARRANSLR